ncbi:urease accessory protein UreE [Celeribacter indicus]|uniref:Urease accessory protein UreE n=1 Tax=Celeribacter indicus TaxID=1208324 RepID=A0A0B5E525_9RHOB|nr:urease accessory protein UreE [Celeribacter indicus]AJE48106.1 urease accessory protein ureE [Celeribacter indicus]SDW32738.1 urease accessory protein [Celeribacter indicus]
MSAAKAYEIVPGGGAGAGDSVSLSYDQRLLRRKKLTTGRGAVIFVDLPQTVSVAEGDAFRTEAGALVAVRAAEEALFEVTGPDVTRYAWHIGNRHTPCEIAPDRLVIQRDPVLRAMLEQLGATVTEIVAPFSPEGGAYGHGRTMGHDHGPAHGPDHGHGGHDPHHDHDHPHAHDHDPAHGHSHSHDGGRTWHSHD